MNMVKDKTQKSRGMLVLEWAKMGDDSCEAMFSSREEFQEKLLNLHTRGFNMHFGNVFTQQFFYYRHENRQDRTKAMDEVLQLQLKEIYGTSNGPLNDWPKVQLGRELFKEAVQE